MILMLANDDNDNDGVVNDGGHLGRPAEQGGGKSGHDQ